MSKKISVILPCYNQGRYLRDAVESLMAQSYTHWECIIINDGSSDETEAFAQEFVRTDKRFIYIKQHNKGLSAARNAGLDLATGAYIQFLDADDAIKKEKFSLQIQALQNCAGPGLSYTDYYLANTPDLNKKGLLRVSAQLSPENPLRDLIKKWDSEIIIPPHCFLFDACFFSAQGIRFDETLFSREDWDCWIQIFKLRPKVFFIKKKLAIYRIHKKSICRQKSSSDSKEVFLRAIVKQQLAFGPESSEYNLFERKKRQVRLIFAEWCGIPVGKYYRFLRIALEWARTF